MTHSPALAAKRIERPLDLLLRAGSHPAAPGQRQPVPRPETEHDREGHERCARHGSARGQYVQPENGRGHARQGEAAGTEHAAALLTTGVVHAALRRLSDWVLITGRSSHLPRTGSEDAGRALGRSS